MLVSLQPDAESDAHDRFPGETTGCMQQAVLVLGPPVAVDILLTDLALRPAAVDVVDFLGVLSDVLHSSFFLSIYKLLFSGVNLLMIV